jgi:hypothetical protein
MLGGYAYMLTLAFTLFAPGVVFDSCHPHASDTNLFAFDEQTFKGSTTTSPLMICGIASTRLHHHGDSATMRLRRHDDFAIVSTSFGALTHAIDKIITSRQD